MVLEEQPVRTPIGPESSVLVVGASRGLGLEFCRQLGSRGATVYATYRGEQAPSALAALVTANPGRVHALPLDVCDDASVEAALARIVKLAKTARPLSHVIHNSGVYGSTSGLGNLKREQMMHTFEVNAVGPVVVAQRAKALLRLPKKAETAVYALLSSKMGSIDDNGSGGSYGYRMSKSALVIVSKSLSIDLRGTAGGTRARAPHSVGSRRAMGCVSRCVGQPC
jgi:NAD(P)-dependent dehydrogenase (short-subunit alcohol dehydrogenase family)